MEKREHFGRFGALMAMAGSAVGLGNLWRFPYLLGENGGAAFLVIYIICAFFIALPIFFCEFIIGRRSGTNSFSAFSALAPGSKWKWVGIIAVITPFIVASFYSVIGGWSVEYLFKACTFEFSASDSIDQLNTIFWDFASSVWPPIIGHTIFLGSTAFIVARGVKHGIESFGKVAMPALFFIVIAMVLYVAFIPGASQGYKYLFKPDFSKVSPSTISAALGQAFFSLSLGCGCIITYASYVRKKENAFVHCGSTALLDLMFALIAACAIMPACFAFGVNPGSGPSVVYEALPFIFSKMPGGDIVAILFFIALLVAALTSSISMFEVIISYMVDEKHISRKKACWLLFSSCWVLGCLCSLSIGPLSDFKIFGYTILEACDKCTSNILMTIGAFLIVTFVGWKMKKADVKDELTSGGSNARFARIFNVVYYMIRYVAPVAILLILITGLIY